MKIKQILTDMWRVIKKEIIFAPIDKSAED